LAWERGGVEGHTETFLLRPAACSLSRNVLRRGPFWWGASLALPVGLLGVPAVSYAGMAFVNLLWHLVEDRDAPLLFLLLGGLVYGFTFSLVLPCLIFGMIGHIGWRVVLRRLAPLLGRAPLLVRLSLWVGAAVLLAPLSFSLALLAYGGPWLLGWLFGVGI
jgi:hypothetical protein